MRYRVTGTQNNAATETAITLDAGSAEEAKIHAERLGYRVAGVAALDVAQSGERWFVGATATVLLIDSFIALFVVAAALGGGERTPWSGRTPWQVIAPAVFVMCTTLLLAQGVYAGSRLARALDLAWVACQLLVTLPVVALVVLGLVLAVARREAVVPWAVLLPVPALRTGAYVFLGYVLWLSSSTRAFLEEQGSKRVQMVTVGSVALLTVVILSLLAMATIPFTAP